MNSRPLLVGILLLLAATSAFAATPAERFAEARQLFRDGELSAALGGLDTLRADYPDDVDYMLIRAQVLARMGRDPEALDELRLASKLAPGYEDVWRTRYSLLMRQQDQGPSPELLEVQDAAAARFPDSSWWRAPAAEQSADWLVSVGAGYDSLSRNLPNWNNQFAEILYRQAGGRFYRARVARDERAATADTSFGIGAETPLPDDWFAGADVSLASDPFYQADIGYSLYAGKVLEDGWVANLRYRRKEYASATIGSAVAGVEKYAGDFRLAYSLSVSRLHGGSSFMNHVATGNWYIDADTSVGITLSTGDEAEAIGNGRVLETDVASLTLSGRQQFGERYSLQWWVGVHDQGELYRRRFLGMAVSIRI
ncbi:MAG: YaiO family outer membrane beta-barrel protein [Woeseiaceae bacterium]|nr:YaiO family outer membrane beta-barrel protein [Woeseiaceae bacterium]